MSEPTAEEVATLLNVCDDRLDQDGWEARCTKLPDHEPPHEGPAVHPTRSEFAILCWDNQTGRGIE